MKIMGQGLRALLRFRRRTILMMLGIMFGIGALSILNTIGENTRRDTLARVKNMLGTFDTILIRPGGKTRGMVSLASVEPTLRFEDADAISHDIAGVKQVAAIENAFDVDVNYRGTQITPAVFGVSANWIDLRGDDLALGSMFSQADVKTLARVAVLGEDVRKALFAGSNPIGQSIRIGGVPFTVQGVIASRGAGPTGASLDNIVLIPVSTASRRLFKRDYLTMIVAQIEDPSHSPAAVEAVTRLLRTRHHLAATALDDFNVTDPRAVFERLVSVGSALQRILKGIAALAMLIGGVVIMSLMVTAVNERRREIGLRRSVGASRGEILWQFLFEAILVSAMGGAAGCLLGMVVINLFFFYEGAKPEVDFGSLALAVGLAAAAGITFGFYPAWRASRIDPVTALRA